MLRTLRVIIGLLLLGAATFSLGGCSSDSKEGGGQASTTDLENAVMLGNANCLQCHNEGKDLTMINDLDTRTIGVVYQDSVHFNPLFNPVADGEVLCEDCHGGGQFHWGLGPLAHPVPDYNVCLQCHGVNNPEHTPDEGLSDMTSFVETVHANTDMQPDKFFFQGGTGTSQAETFGMPEVTPDNVPVTKNQHIEECSVCHNSNQRFVYDNSGNLIKPDPENMANPTVSCANCHDAHQTGKIVLVPTRAAGSNPQGNVIYPIFRKSQIAGEGVWNRPIIYQPNGAVQTDGSVDPSKVIGKNNELSVELVCAACHTKGEYKYSRQQTHQENVYPQWKNSGHGTRDDPAFAEFSANPPAYTNPDTGIPYDVGTHSPSYPVDMALSAFGAVANTTQNAGNNIFLCFHCHNGIGSIVWQEDAQGTPDADVVFGDESVTCITCHETHEQPEGTSHLIRVPVAITQYSGVIVIKGNVFLDNTPVPVQKAGNGIICIFCHQGRESGLTLYATKLAPGRDITGNFFNPHYLGTAAMVWGVNAYEYAGKSYSANTAHQGANCPTCHMANPTDDNLNGGHTWWPNVATCNVAACHGGASLGPIAADPASENGPASPDVDNYRAVFDTNNYTGDPGGASLSIAASIQVLEKKIIDLLAAQGIEYDDLHYPYFFQAGMEHTNANAFKAWTPAAYKAAFNLSYVIKGLPSGAESQIDVPNASAAVHDYKYIIQLLLDGYEDLTGAPLAGAFRPAGTRPATVYGPGQ